MDPAQTGRTPHTLRRNLIIFTISIVASGWVGILIDKLTGQPDYQDVATLNGGGTLGMGVWTVAPLLVVIALRTFCGDGWKNAGYALNVRGKRVALRTLYCGLPCDNLCGYPARHEGGSHARGSAKYVCHPDAHCLPVRDTVREKLL